MTLQVSSSPADHREVARTIEPPVESDVALVRPLTKGAARDLVEIFDADVRKSTLAQDELDGFRKQRLLMCRVGIKVTGSDDKIFRIRRLADQQPAGPERPPNLVEQLDQGRECEMLDKMKSRHRAKTIVGQAAQVSDRFRLNDFKPTALVERRGIPNLQSPIERYVPSVERVKSELKLRQLVDLQSSINKTIMWAESQR